MNLPAILLKTAHKYNPYRIDNLQQTGGIAQLKLLKKLIGQSAETAFGKAYQFNKIQHHTDFLQMFQDEVPVYTYEKMYDYWWHRALKGEPNISWPGTVKYFALTSGTSKASSKKIPVTQDMIHAIRKVSTRQYMSLSHLNLPASFYKSSYLMLGGTTTLKQVNNHLEGDLSGIMAQNLPFWFTPFYKPGKKLAKEEDWNTKINLITREAKNWNIGALAGVPAWLQLLMENIVHYHNVKSIHEIWPNLQVFSHGGVSFEPYKNSFATYLSKPIHYLETYLASEGFIACQLKPGSNGMKLALNHGIFYEFIPFNQDNFTETGQLKPGVKAKTIFEVEQGIPYALLLTTCSGAFRYLIGDVIKFTSVEDMEIVISGRITHYLSLCGEHLSIENMTQAIATTAKTLHININEFAVTGVPHHNFFAHQWYIGTDQPIDPLLVKINLDRVLRSINDDYNTERNAALKDIMVKVYPTKVFYDWMNKNGKIGGQHKFPRVLSSQVHDNWCQFTKEATW